LNDEEGEAAPLVVSEINGQNGKYDPGDLWLEGESASVVSLSNDEPDFENDIECDISAMIALGDKGTGLPPKAKRQFWRLKRSKGLIHGIFKDVLVALIMQAATRDLLDSQLNAEQRASHIETVNQACLKMTMYQVVREACEFCVKHEHAIGGFQDRLLTRSYRGDGTR